MPSSEGRHAVLADAVNPEAAVFRLHADGQVEEPIFLLAEEICDVAG